MLGQAFLLPKILDQPVLRAAVATSPELGAPNTVRHNVTKVGRPTSSLCGDSLCYAFWFCYVALLRKNRLCYVLFFVSPWLLSYVICYVNFQDWEWLAQINYAPRQVQNIPHANSCKLHIIYKSHNIITLHTQIVSKRSAHAAFRLLRFTLHF